MTATAYSFSGGAPIKSDAGSGNLYERHSVRAPDDSLPQLQQYYIRPNRATTLQASVDTGGRGGEGLAAWACDSHIRLLKVSIGICVKACTPWAGMLVILLTRK